MKTPDSQMRGVHTYDLALTTLTCSSGPRSTPPRWSPTTRCPTTTLPRPPTRSARCGWCARTPANIPDKTGEAFTSPVLCISLYLFYLFVPSVLPLSKTIPSPPPSRSPHQLKFSQNCGRVTYVTMRRRDAPWNPNRKSCVGWRL